MVRQRQQQGRCRSPSNPIPLPLYPYTKVHVEKSFDRSKGNQNNESLEVHSLSVCCAAASVALAAKNPMVGGHEMYPTKDIVDNAVNSSDHTTLVAAVKAAGLVDTLKGSGPLTVFAPTNSAFEKLPAGTVDRLVKPENKDMLTKILTYHVVSGRLSAMDLKKLIKAGHGKAGLATVSGGKLWVMMKGNSLVLKDEKGGMATITQADVFQSNGVIHVIDTVVIPE